MVPKKADVDLKQTTLAILPGWWNKLLYFARLRTGPDKKYEHWGMERKYGDEAIRALSEAHAETFGESLRRPIQELLHDAEGPGTEERLNADGVLEGMIPGGLEQGPRRHFRFVFTAVRELMKAKRRRPVE